MALILGSQHVMTCCHVLNDALGRQNRLDPERPPPETHFSIRFPYARNAQGSGRVVQWGFELQQAKDVAVLELIEEAPAEAGVATFSEGEVQREKWSCIGWDSEGVNREAQGEFGTLLAGDERQLNGPSGGVAVRIAGGYSGAGVWADNLTAFVGMVMTKDRDQHENGLAYAIPTTVLLQIWPKLPLIRRRGRRMWWLLLAIVFLLLIGFLSWWWYPHPCKVWGRYAETELASDIESSWDKDELPVKEKELLSHDAACIAVTGVVKRREGNEIVMRTERRKGTVLRVYLFVFESSGTLDPSITANVEVIATGRIDKVTHPGNGRINGSFQVKIKDAEIRPH
jgi:hypothetical protein